MILRPDDDRCQQDGCDEDAVGEMAYCAEHLEMYRRRFHGDPGVNRGEITTQP